MVSSGEDAPEHLLQPAGCFSAGVDEDKDLAMAKLLQQQENAFMMVMQGGDSNSYSEASEGEDEAGDAAAAAPQQEVALTDEELARLLQSEEDQGTYRRMLELAGMTDNGEAAADEEDDAYDPDNMTYEDLSALGEVVGVVSKGLPAVVVGRLPEVAFSEWTSSSRSTRDQACAAQDMCAICRMDFDTEDMVKVLPCRHIYHTACVGQWLGVNKVCPVCSTEVPSAPPGQQTGH